MEVEASLKRFVTTLPEKYKVAKGDCILNGCIFEIDDKNCKTIDIRRINI